jgi:hypothetical protein
MPWIDDLPAELADTLSDEIKTNPTVMKYNSFAETMNGLISAASLVGDSIRVPGPDAGEEDNTAFYQKLIDKAPNLMIKPDFSNPEQSDEYYKLAGRPDESTGYTRSEDIKIDEDVENELREVLFKAGLTDSQFKKVIGQFSAAEAQRVELEQTARQEAESGLKSKWGMTVDERIAAAKNINDEFYPGRDFGSVTPKEIESLYAIHESTTGKGPQAATQEGSVGGMTPAEAKEQMAEIMSRVHDPKNNLSHGEKMALIQKRMDMGIKYLGMEGSIDPLRV